MKTDRQKRQKEEMTERQREIERKAKRQNDRKKESMIHKALNDTIDGDLEMN